MNIVYAGESNDSVGPAGSSCSNESAKGPRVYLAGSWFQEAIQYLQDMKFNGTVLVPVQRNGVNINLDVDAMCNSDIILFWKPDPFDFLLFGMFLHHPTIIMLYGRPDGTEYLERVDHVYQKCRRETPYNSLKALCESIISDEAGLDKEEIDVVVKFANCTRKKAANALREHGNIVDAILALQ